jgi:hypothetical protein
MEMKISEEKAATLRSCQERANQLVFQIGRTEITKIKLMGELTTAEAKAQEIILEIKENFAIPDGTSFQVLPDGSIKIVPSENTPPPSEGDGGGDPPDPPEA